MSMKPITYKHRQEKLHGLRSVIISSSKQCALQTYMWTRWNTQTGRGEGSLKGGKRCISWHPLERAKRGSVARYEVRITSELPHSALPDSNCWPGGIGRGVCVHSPLPVPQKWAPCPAPCRPAAVQRGLCHSKGPKLGEATGHCPPPVSTFLEEAF